MTLLLDRIRQRRSERWPGGSGPPAGAITRLVPHAGGVVAVSARGAALWSTGRWQECPEPPVPEEEVLPGLPSRLTVQASARARGARYVLTERGLFREGSEGYAPFGPPSRVAPGQPVVDADARFTCIVADGAGTLWIGSDRGCFAADGEGWWNVFDRTAGLPYEEVTCLLPAADGTLWIGTREGLCRMLAGGWHYYWGPRWLPGNEIHCLLEEGGAVWAGTDGGAARIYEEHPRFHEKAAHYQAITEARHDRRGWVTACRLRVPGRPDAGGVHEASDNDGLWTGLYVAAQSFRWAVTGEPEARTRADRSMQAMLELLRATGIPGFPARALVHQGEEVDGWEPEETVRIEGSGEPIWFRSPLRPDVWCKGDTSSDELDGHYFAWSVYHDLAAGPGEKSEVREAVAAVTDHLLRNRLQLVGHTGEPTRWGIYAPEKLNDDPAWWDERGLNALSILAYLKTAGHICGNPAYAEAYRTLVRDHHYAQNTLLQKVAEPWTRVNHSDDEMAFMMYYTLLRLEEDPDLRRLYLRSLERSWQIERPERSPFFNFVYGALTGAPCDAEAAAQTLAEWPWELVDWEMRGTHRHDVEVRAWRGRARSRLQTVVALSPAERPMMRWNGNPYQCDGGTPEGRHEECGTAWLLPYWLGRYHRLIDETPAS